MKAPLHLLRKLKHAFQRAGGTLPQILRDPHFRRHVAQTVAKLFQCVQLHVFTFGTGTFFGGNTNKFFAWNKLAQAVQDAAFRNNDETLSFALAAIRNHFFR